MNLETGIKENFPKRTVMHYTGGGKKPGRKRGRGWRLGTPAGERGLGFAPDGKGGRGGDEERGEGGTGAGGRGRRGEVEFKGGL